MLRFVSFTLFTNHRLTVTLHHFPENFYPLRFVLLGVIVKHSYQPFQIFGGMQVG